MKKYIKLPNSGLVRRKPQKLKLFLADNTQSSPVPEHVFDFAARNSDFGTGANQPDYKTDSFDIERIARYEVTIIGAGSVGSFIAYFLAFARLILNVIDFKKVENKHISSRRTVFEAVHIGLNKVDALKKKIERDFLGTVVNSLPYNLSGIPDTELKSMFARSALVIIAIDDPVQLLRAAQLAYPVVEFIQAALHRGAKSGHIAISIPFVTPCLQCTLGINSHNDINALRSEPANPFDIVTVVQMAAKIAIDIIYSKATGQNITRWDTSKNLIYIANTKQELSPEGPGIIMEGSSKRPGCPICNQTLLPQKGGI